MNFEEKIQDLMQKVEHLSDDNKLQDKTYFLDDSHVLTFPRTDGDSRYPYGTDGFNFWTCASGYMYATESDFDAFEYVEEGKEPTICFFAGFPKEDGTYEPVSLIGVPINLDIDAKRYMIHTPKAAYYFTFYRGMEFCVRVFVDNNKTTYFSIYANNTTDKPQKLYFSNFINPTLLNVPNCDPHIRWWRECRKEAGSPNNMDSFVAKTCRDISRTAKLTYLGIINRQYYATVEKSEVTASRAEYMGGKSNGLYSSVPLKTGTFGKNPCEYCTFIDYAAFGDMNYVTVPAKESVRFELSFAFAQDEAAVSGLVNKKLDKDTIDALLADLVAQEEKEHAGFKLTMNGFHSDKIKDGAFNHFFQFVQRQVEYCALGKNYAGMYLGIRDVFQQIEGALMWQPEKCAQKIEDVIAFIDPSGRVPRQITFPPAEGIMPNMNLQLFIDQGVWIISTIVTYLRYTKDFDLLKKECSYYKITDEKSRAVVKTDYKDSILTHMLHIMDFLLETRDDETKCVRAMFGDWNDALDGLGVSKDPDKQFGSGVSVMVTLQTYQNLDEMIQLLSIVDAQKYADKIAEYQKAREEIKEGLLKYAVMKNDQGETKILHGWGDKRSYVVGGFQDVDGEDRVGLTSYAFWVLSGMYNNDPSMKDTILHAYSRLDDKYGLRTFDVPFAPDAPGVGRITNLPAGTAENACSYVHATTFAIASLLQMGCSDEAIRQLEKALPLTHERISTTPFIMSNSYCYNPEKNIDGQSMSDWHTGSGAVLLKMLVKYVAGFDPQFGGISIHPAATLPADSFDFTVYPRGCEFHISYQNNHSGKRTFTVNGKERDAKMDGILQTKVLWINDEELENNKKMDIIITD